VGQPEAGHGWEHVTSGSAASSSPCAASARSSASCIRTSGSHSPSSVAPPCVSGQVSERVGGRIGCTRTGRERRWLLASGTTRPPGSCRRSVDLVRRTAASCLRVGCFHGGAFRLRLCRCRCLCRCRRRCRCHCRHWTHCQRHCDFCLSIRLICPARNQTFRNEIMILS